MDFVNEGKRLFEAACLFIFETADMYGPCAAAALPCKAWLLRTHLLKKAYPQRSLSV